MIYLSDTQQQILANGEFNQMDMLRLFRNEMNPNFNSSTLYHGLDDILRNTIPQFFMDNLREDDLKKLVEIGWSEKE